MTEPCISIPAFAIQNMLIHATAEQSKAKEAGLSTTEAYWTGQIRALRVVIMTAQANILQ